MIKTVEWLRRNSLVQGILSIGGGTMFGQVIGILISPILTRLYTPAAMGMWGLFVSFVSVAGVAGALRYEVGIVAAKEEQDARTLTGYAFALSVLISFIGGGLFEVFRHYGILGYEVFPWWMGGMAILAIAVNIWGQIFRWWFVRQKEFRVVGYFVAGRGVFRALAQLFLSSCQGIGLIFGEILGRLVSLSVLLPRFPFGEVLRRDLFGEGGKVLKRFIRYPLVFLPSAFVDTLALMAPVPVFTAEYGVEVGGMLALAQRVVGVPLALLGNAVADVFFGEISDVARNDVERVFPLFLKSTFRLGNIALLLGVILWWLAPGGVAVIFGARWEVSGRMLRVMTPWFVAMLTVNPISRLVFLSRYPWMKLFYDLFALIGATLPLWLDFPDPIGALLFVSWVQAGLYIIYWIVLFVAVRRGLEVK